MKRSQKSILDFISNKKSNSSRDNQNRDDSSAIGDEHSSAIGIENYNAIGKGYFYLIL